MRPKMPSPPLRRTKIAPVRPNRSRPTRASLTDAAGDRRRLDPGKTYILDMEPDHSDGEPMTSVQAAFDRRLRNMQSPVNHELIVKPGKFLPGCRFWFIRDSPMGIYTLPWVYVLLGYGLFVMHVVLFPGMTVATAADVLSVLAFDWFTVLAVISHVKCVTTDPGATTGDTEPEGDTRPRFCKLCRWPKPERAHHCSVCRRCVVKMDHHCPWVNNCVGHRNLKPFILFNLYVCLLSTTGVLTGSVKSWACQSSATTYGLTCTNWLVSGLGGDLLWVAWFEGVVFATCTFCLLSCTLLNVLQDTTHIERLRRGFRTRLSGDLKLSRLREVFGPPSPGWFSPLHSTTDSPADKQWHVV